MPRSYVKGGKRLDKFLRNAARASKAKQTQIDAGFVDNPHVARLAARLEFGDPRSALPERPAFRGARAAAAKAGAKILSRSLGKGRRVGDYTVDDDDAEKAADAMAAEIQRSYETFHGAATGERQVARKKGTPGAGRQLVGTEGPKLISHIKGRVRKAPRGP